MRRERIIEIEFGSDLMGEAFALRYEVFVDEQGVPRELEVDEHDAGATHLVAIRDDRVIGTLRILDHGGAAKVRRVAVRAAARPRGIASRLTARSAAMRRWTGCRGGGPPPASALPCATPRENLGGGTASRLTTSGTQAPRPMAASSTRMSVTAGTRMA